MGKRNQINYEHTIFRITSGKSIYMVGVIVDYRSNRQIHYDVCVLDKNLDEVARLSFIRKGTELTAKNVCDLLLLPLCASIFGFSQDSATMSVVSTINWTL